MTVQRQMELLVVRYVPYATDSKHLDIGLIVFEKANEFITFADVRFISNMEAVLVIDPDADVDMLQSSFRDFERRLLDPSDRVDFIRTMRDTFSNVFQFSDPKAVLMSATPERDVDDLASLYLSHSQTS